MSLSRAILRDDLRARLMAGQSAAPFHVRGDMIGSGIYGTLGKGAGLLGNAVWLAFLVSMLAALITGLCYASVASRYPRAAGAAFVTHHAFGFAFLSYLIGLTEPTQFRVAIQLHRGFT